MTDEYNAEEDDWRETLRSGIGELEANALVIVGEVEKAEAQTLAVRPGRTDGRIKEGDYVRVAVHVAVSPGTSYQEAVRSSSEAVVKEISSDGTILLARRGGPPFPQEGAVIVGPNEPVLRYWEDQKSILRAAGGAVPFFEKWDDGASEPEWKDWDGAFEELRVSRKGLHFYQGPPGTGKTRLIAAAAIARARSGQSVLVMAFTHRALDAFADAFAEQGTNELPPLCKVSSVQADKVNARFSVINEPTAVKGAVVLVTSHRLFREMASRQSGRIGFDLLFVDEASQFALPALACASTAAGEVVYVGDPYQLGPVTKSDSEGEIVDGFHAAYRRKNFTVLSETFRMSPPLCGYIGKAFYDEKLTSRVSANGTFPPAGIALIPVFPSEDKPEQTAGEREAEVVRDIIAGIAEKNGKTGPLTCIVSCIHRRQVSRIHNRLGLLNVLTRVDSVERNQGQTAEVAGILSMGLDARQLGSRGNGWTFDFRRMNVALSRARTASYLTATPGIINLAISEANPDTVSRTAWQILFAELSDDLRHRVLRLSDDLFEDTNEVYIPTRSDRLPSDKALEKPAPKEPAPIPAAADRRGEAKTLPPEFTWKGTRRSFPSGDDPIWNQFDQPELAKWLADIFHKSPAEPIARTATYQQAARHLGYTVVPQLFPVLGRLQSFCRAQNLFDLSALVVSAKTARPSANHYTTADCANEHEWTEYMEKAAGYRKQDK